MARNFAQEKWHQLKYFYRSSGPRGVAVEVLRKSIAIIYCRNTAHLLTYRVDPNGPDSEAVDATLPLSMQHVVVRDPTSLKSYESELSPSMNYSYSQLRAAVRSGSVLFLMRHPREDGTGHRILGYSLHERGMVEAFGHRYRASADTLFLHYTEVLPAYRGLRIAFYIAEVVAAYSRGAAITRWFTWIGKSNRAALNARKRIGWVVAGQIRQIIILGGLITLQTSRSEVEDMLR